MKVYIVKSGQTSNPRDWGAFDTREKAEIAAKGLSAAMQNQERWWVVSYQVNDIMLATWDCVAGPELPGAERTSYPCVIIRPGSPGVGLATTVGSHAS